MNADAVGWKLTSQYEITENKIEMRTGGDFLLDMACGGSFGYGRLTQVGETNDEVGNDKCRCAIETILTFFDECQSVFQEAGDVGNGHKGHEGRTKELE